MESLGVMRESETSMLTWLGSSTNKPSRALKILQSSLSFCDSSAVMSPSASTSCSIRASAEFNIEPIAW